MSRWALISDLREEPMPHTVQLREIIDELLTANRLNSYKSVFSPTNDYELVGAYLWNARVCAALYPVMSAAEIALRNSIDRVLTASPHGTFWWTPNKLQWRSRSTSSSTPFVVNALRQNFTKASQQVINEKRQRYQMRGRITPSHSEIIAKTDFSTWGFILDDEFMGSHLIWPTYLTAVFRGPFKGRRLGLMLSHLRDLVSNTRNYRNRLFHHEPAWKKSGVRNENDAVAYLGIKLGQIIELVELIHPEQITLLRRNGLLGDAERACSLSELRRFQLTAKEQRVRSARTFDGVAKKAWVDNCVTAVRANRGGDQRFLLVPFT